MASRTAQIVALVAAVAFVGTLTTAVVAVSGDAGENGGLMRHLHQLGRHLHGGGGQHGHMAEVIEQLELTPDQMRRFEKIHQIVGSFGHGGGKAMGDLHDRLVTQFEQGYVGTDEIRRAIDTHLEEFRGMAYAVTDELVALINELDESQREVLLKHLEEAKSGERGHGHH